MSNIFHRRSRLGRSTDGYLHISPVPGSPKGRYSFLRENLSPSYLLYYRKNLRRQRTSTTCILIGKKARNISVRPSFRERNKNSNEKSCKRERARERERERERDSCAATSSVKCARTSILYPLHNPPLLLYTLDAAALKEVLFKVIQLPSSPSQSKKQPSVLLSGRGFPGSSCHANQTSFSHSPCSPTFSVLLPPFRSLIVFSFVFHPCVPS